MSQTLHLTYTCDRCGLQSPQVEYSGPPAGWAEVESRPLYGLSGRRRWTLCRECVPVVRAALAPVAIRSRSIPLTDEQRESLTIAPPVPMPPPIEEPPPGLLGRWLGHTLGTVAHVLLLAAVPMPFVALAWWMWGAR